MHWWRRGDCFSFGACRLKRISTNLDKKSLSFKKNFESMKELVAELNKKKRLVKIGGSLEARKKHIKRGKLLPRERVKYLLDNEKENLEIGSLAGMDINKIDIPCVVYQL